MYTRQNTTRAAVLNISQSRDENHVHQRPGRRAAVERHVKHIRASRRLVAEGKGFSEATGRAVKAYVPTIIRNWCVAESFGAY